MNNNVDSPSKKSALDSKLNEITKKYNLDYIGILGPEFLVAYNNKNLSSKLSEDSFPYQFDELLRNAKKIHSYLPIGEPRKIHVNTESDNYLLILYKNFDTVAVYSQGIRFNQHDFESEVKKMVVSQLSVDK